MARAKKLTDDDLDLLRRGLRALLDQECESILKFARENLAMREPAAGEGAMVTSFFDGSWDELDALIGDRAGIMPRYHDLEARVSELLAKLERPPRKPRAKKTTTTATSKARKANGNAKPRQRKTDRAEVAKDAPGTMGA